MSVELFMEKLLEGVEVEWPKLEDVSDIKTGGHVSKKLIQDNPGKFPVVNSGREPLGFISEWNTENDPIGITSRGAGVGSITWQEGRYFRGNLNYAVTLKSTSSILTKYLFYLLHEMQPEIKAISTFQGIPALNAGALKKLKIPIPPLNLQTEIVRILDAFTGLTAELTAELETRKKQYHYYRNQLLTFEEGAIEWKNLGDVVTIKNGKDWKKLGSGKIPVYGSGGVMNYVDTYSYNKPTVLIPRKGSITNIFYLDTPFWNVDTIYYTEIDAEQILPKYFYYFMSTVDLMALDTGSGRPSLTQAILNKLRVPVPLLDEQERIVSTLDKFDTLTHSITEGLPREIELRQKQYEYYREKLLSFSKPEESAATDQ